MFTYFVHVHVHEHVVLHEHVYVLWIRVGRYWNWKKNPAGKSSPIETKIFNSFSNFLIENSHANLPFYLATYKNGRSVADQ